MSQAQRPLLLPEPYDGATGSWPEWEAHFENVAAVNKWESEEEKLVAACEADGEGPDRFHAVPGSYQE